MTEDERERHRQDAEGYMANCNDTQLANIICDERERIRRFGEGDVAIVARIMLNAAKSEARRRGLSEE